MFFIVKGFCKVIKADGFELATLKSGQNFGEMALLDPKNPLRSASVVSLTKCSLAVLTRADFELICKMYPAFKDKIFELVRKRKMSNSQKEKDQHIMEQQNANILGVVQEELIGSQYESSRFSSQSSSD